MQMFQRKKFAVFTTNCNLSKLPNGVRRLFVLFKITLQYKENPINAGKTESNLKDNQILQQKLDNLTNEFATQKKQITENNNIIIKNEIQKGINDYINKSQLELQNKQNEINNIKNDYQNNINKIREECYEELEQKFSKFYEQKIKDIYNTVLNNSKIMCDQILSNNQKQFEEEEKKEIKF